MAEYGFNLFWSDEDQGFIVTCPDFPGLSAFGETLEEALAEAKVALELIVESVQEAGKTLPAPTREVEYSGQCRLRMPKSLHSALVKKASLEGVSLNTWIVNLLSERNALSRITDMICSRIEGVETAINDHHAETKKIRFAQNTTYNSEITKGDMYGKVEPLLN